MAKLTKKEKDKLTRQMVTVTRGETWVGTRPIVFRSKKHDKKLRRKENKKLCTIY